MNYLQIRRLRQFLISKRVYVLAFVYLMISAMCYELAYQLRFEFAVAPGMREIFWKTLPWILGTKFVLFHAFGCFRGSWRFVTFADLAVLLQVATLSTLAIAAIDYFALQNYQIPRAVVLIDWDATVLVIGGLRSTWRLVREHGPLLLGRNGNGRRRALLIGAEQGGEALARQLHSNPQLEYRIAGFLDQNASRHGSRLGGIPFLGSPRQAVEIADQQRATDILVIAKSVGGVRLRKLMEDCSQAGVNVKMIPSIDEMLSGSLRMQVRDVDIHDLLRRDPVELDKDAIADMLKGHRILVTGAGGSIGSEICRQIAQCQPDRLILVERAENSLFRIEQELIKNSHGVEFDRCLADVCDRERLEAIFGQYQPEIVFHAAAHKHVPMMELNPGEAIKNNVFGTIELADVAEEFGVERFVLLSTDKAVNPKSVMGASKQLAERYAQALAKTSRTKFVSVRFGNVLASDGSVVPTFQEQIRRGGPITVTHSEMTRFFMTIPEACQLVLQAAAMGEGGEIYVLDMGEPVRIVDLARDLVRLSGLAPQDIDIEFVGLRPGEKLNEALYSQDEQTRNTQHPKLQVVCREPEEFAEVCDSIYELKPLLHTSHEALREKLAEIVPGFTQPDQAEAPEESNVEEFTMDGTAELEEVVQSAD
jgi:FlaA1/EpsC-like NDP-sugar epimerase